MAESKTPPPRPEPKADMPADAGATPSERGGANSLAAPDSPAAEAVDRATSSLGQDEKGT